MSHFKENKNFKIKKTRNGEGIFTKYDFLPERVLFRITGPFVTCDLDEDIDDVTRSNAIRFDENYYISPQGRIADYLNHSCNPNAKVVKKGNRLYIAAIRRIPQNREVLIDYSTITAADDIWKMNCNCGSRQCRGVIKNVAKLSKEIRTRYRKQEVIPQHIWEIE